MLKVFLVEDEFVVREGIKKNIDWEGHGYEFCGDASDGELAFPMIQKQKPDIVITDIKMPFMDGLELSKLIKKELPWTEIIILSGHQEFEYAKEGIKIGVAQYLSKPINGADLLKEVDVVAKKIEENRKEREIKEKYIQEMQENILEEKRKLFQYLVTGSKTVVELLEIADKLSIDLSSMWYNVILFEIESLNHSLGEYSKSLIEIEEKIEKLNDENHFVVFDRNLEGKAILLKADTKEELEEFQNKYLTKLQEILAEYKQVRYFCGVGKAVNRLGEVTDSFERASHAFAHRYLIKESRIMDSEELEKSVNYQKEEFDISNVNPKQIDRNKIREFLKYGDKSEVVYFVEEYFKDLGMNVMKSNIFRQYITLDTYFYVVEFLESIQVPKDEIPVFEVESGVTYNKEGAIQYIIETLEQALELREKSASNRYGDITEEIIRYIEQNFSDDELSLNSVASHVNFSPNYLSMVFSQQMGQTFIKYLTDFRMNKAKELLRCSEKRSSVIAVEVGYKDPHYFSYLFKKTQGVTPTQYREGKYGEGEN